MKSVVTGVAGFIGSNLASHLIAHGHTVVGVDNFLSGKRANLELLKGHIQFTQGDVRDTARLTELFKGNEVVFHLAAFVSVPASVEDPATAHDHNVNGTHSVLLAARNAGVRRVVFASSAAVYGDNPALPAPESAMPAPASPYALHKLVGEQYLTLFQNCYSLETVACRFFNVFGPRQDPASAYAAAIPRILARILGGERPIIHGDGEQTRDFIYIEDIIQGLTKAATAPTSATGAVYNLGAGGRVSINELVLRLLALTGSTLEPLHEPARLGDVRHSQADISMATFKLGFEPQYDALSGLDKAIGWYRENLG